LSTRWHRLKTGRRILSRSLLYLVIAAFAVVTFFPFFWMVSTSLKPRVESFQVPPTWVPRQPTLENYLRQALHLAPSSTLVGFPIFYRNGLIVSAGTVLITVLSGILAAYSLSRYKFFGKNGVLLFLIVTQMFPYAVVAINIYIMFSALRLINTYHGLILAISALTLPFSIWLLKGFFDKIPMELEDAAKVDGCGRMTLVFRILVPTITPGVIAVGLFNFLGSWNTLLFPLTLAYRNDMYTIAPGFLRLYIGQYMILWPDMSAGSVMVTLPIVIAFIALQRYFIQGLTSGAVKG